MVLFVLVRDCERDELAEDDDDDDDGFVIGFGDGAKSISASASMPQISSSLLPIWIF